MTDSQCVLPMLTTPIRHPARYTHAILETIAPYLKKGWRVLDPFAGVGGLARLGYTGARVYLNELEPVCISQAAGGCRVNGNAFALPFAGETFDAVATSPTYGNRIADHHQARDASRRNTYFHALGALHPDNTGLLHFGAAYCERHTRAWCEAHRVLKVGGLFLLNVSDHIRAGQRVYVSKWHYDTARAVGFRLLACHAVKTPRNRYGANGQLRCPVEYIFVFQKEPTTKPATSRTSEL